MYGKVLGAATPLATAAVLPATGMDLVTTLAVSLGAGLLTWGVAYAVQHAISK